MFYTYILRSLSQPEQRYIGNTADLQARLAIRRFFLPAKISGVQRSGRSSHIGLIRGFFHTVWSENRCYWKWQMLWSKLKKIGSIWLFIKSIAQSCSELFRNFNVFFHQITYAIFPFRKISKNRFCSKGRTIFFPEIRHCFPNRKLIFRSGFLIFFWPTFTIGLWGIHWEICRAKLRAGAWGVLFLRLKILFFYCNPYNFMICIDLFNGVY